MNPLSFQIEHLGLAARDPRTLAGWYCSVLDGRIAWQSPGDHPAFFVTLPDSTLLEIYPASDSTPATGNNAIAGFRHLALRVTSIEGTAALLRTRGVEFPGAVKPAGGGGSVLFFSDPEGNLLHLVERPAGSPLA